jgi:hypothetical protein
MLTLCPFVHAQNNEIPAWEIGLAAGSGALALVLCLFAVYSFRQSSNTVKKDVESGLRTGQTTMSSGVRQPPLRPTGPGAGTGVPRSAPRGGNTAPIKTGTRPSTRPISVVDALDRANAAIDDSVDTSKSIISALGGIAVKTGNVVGQAASGAKEVGASAVTKAKETGQKVAAALRDNPDDPMAREQAKLAAAKKAASLSAQRKETSTPAPARAPAPAPAPPVPAQRSQIAKPRGAVANGV